MDTQKLVTDVYNGEVGYYQLWDPSKLPILGERNVGAAKLCLKKKAFALPHYADSSKLAFVIQGTGVAGIVLDDKEKVVALRKGDVIALPLKAISWWYNNEDTDLIILFAGDTSKAITPGVFTYFFLTGSIGIFNGFSTELVARAWSLPEDAVKTLMTCQSAALVTKLDNTFQMPEPKEEDRHGLVFNLEEAPPDVDVENGGRLVVATFNNLPFLGPMGLRANLGSLHPNATCSPGLPSDPAVRITYVIRGSGRVQVVGANGIRVLDALVKAGDLFIVPRFFLVLKVANDDGLDCFSVITTPEPSFTELAGKTSVWKTLSPEVLRVSFNVPKDIEQQFRLANTSHAIFTPPK